MTNLLSLAAQITRDHALLERMAEWEEESREQARRERIDYERERAERLDFEDWSN